MKSATTAPKPERPVRKRPAPRFASMEEFLAAEQKRFQEVFGGVDWEQAKRLATAKPGQE
ncbi:hypothetical protein [uncultured Hymenobacter sp.]|uniref:hypothetical protein n=1 Tax=uncultured Hymenobacter sp. TaxID=170016 RepID=UPI0035C99CF9